MTIPKKRKLKIKHRKIKSKMILETQTRNERNKKVQKIQAKRRKDMEVEVAKVIKKDVIPKAKIKLKAEMNEVRNLVKREKEKRESRKSIQVSIVAQIKRKIGSIDSSHDRKMYLISSMYIDQEMLLSC